MQTHAHSASSQPIHHPANHNPRIGTHTHKPTQLQVRQWHHWENEAPSSDTFLKITNSPVTPRHRGSRAGPKSSAWSQSPDRALRRLRASAKALWRRVGTSRWAHGARVAIAVVTTDLIFSPVNRAVYYSLRLVFIDRLNLDHSFDFANFVER